MGWQGGQGGSISTPEMAKIWLRSPPEAPNWVKDNWIGPQMFPPIAPDWFESIPGNRKLWRLNQGLERCVEAVFD